MSKKLPQRMRQASCGGVYSSIKDKYRGGKQPLIIKNARIFTENQVIEWGWLRCEGAHIAQIQAGEAPAMADVPILDAAGATLLPGFMDLHVHGAMGHDVMDATPEALLAIARHKLQHGVTGWLPTTLTDTPEQIYQAVSRVARLMASADDDPVVASILGVHLEGPYLNRTKAGAQNPQHIRRADPAEYRPLLAMDVIRLVSIAPEFAENLALLDECVQRGIAVSIAHTDATYEQAAAAMERGIRHATHTGNAMRGIHHRDVGTLGAVLLDERVRCEVIADTVHLHPAMLKLIYKLIGAGRMILITDAMRAAGLGEGAYRLGMYDVLVQDGRARLADGTLAGSVLTMDQGLRNVLAATGAPLEDLWRVTSYNAAQALRLLDRGSIAPGKRADLVLLDAALQVQKTILQGKIVYDKQIRGNT